MVRNIGGLRDSNSSKGERFQLHEKDRGNRKVLPLSDSPLDLATRNDSIFKSILWATPTVHNHAQLPPQARHYLTAIEKCPS